MEKTVVELFAGVGGFRVGLNHITRIAKDGHAIEQKHFDFVWANQREPATKTQHAFDCYNVRFPNENNSNVDISLVNKKDIPNHNLLVGGFPCQDYSVAHSLSHSKGIEGKKGVLWWQIRDILQVKRPPFVLLENVDRLLKSPAKQRGRDFGIILRCFADLGYSVEWRVINAGEFGHPQRRRRTFIFAWSNSTEYSRDMSTIPEEEILLKYGIFAKQFKSKKDINKKAKTINIKKYEDLADFSDNFSFSFENSGVMLNYNVFTLSQSPESVKIKSLDKIIEHNEVDSHFFLTQKEISKFEYLRGSKKIPRVRPNGEEYFYSEGSMSPYDDLKLPGRTMLTSEGSINRSTHIIMDVNRNKLRKLTPIECERMNEFPDNWTNTMPEKRRYFMMGNALVCGIVKKLGAEIERIIEYEP